MRQLLPIREGAIGFVAEHEGRKRSYPKHSHAELELNLVTSGHATYWVADRMLRIVEDCLLVLEPEQEHVLGHVSGDFRMWVIALRDDASGVAEQVAAPSTTSCRALPHAKARLLSELCSHLVQAGSLAVLNSGLAFLRQLADEATHTSKAPQLGATLHPAVAATLRHIQRNPQLDAFQLAKRVDSSAPHLRRLFKRQMGISLTRYRNRARLEQARMRLDAGNGTALEAALASGFGSYSQFYRVFREETGCTPRQVRELKRR